MEFNRASIILALLALLFSLFFVGCKKKTKDYLGDIRENTLTMNSDGSLLEIACQNFAGVTYDISTLKDDINSQIDAYKSKYGENDDTASVKLLQYEEKDGFVRVALEYSSMDAYNRFNNTNYVAGASAGILPQDIILKDLGGNDVVLSDVIKDEYKVFLIDDDYTLTINGSIMYYNSHVTLREGQGIARTDGADTAVIIYR